MSGFFRVVAAEVLKQQRQLFSNKRVYFSLLLWPLLLLVASYYMYKPFVLERSRDFGGFSFANEQSLLLFVLTGQLGYTFIYAMTESAWRLTWERAGGTLEAVFLAPVNRVAFLVGQSLAFLVQGMWMYTVMFIAVAATVGSQTLTAIAMGVLGLVVLVVAATAWGCLLNSLFLLSRDSGLLFTLCQSPVRLLCGVEVPLAALPFPLQLVGNAIPLSAALRILRIGLMRGDMKSILPTLGLMLASCGAMLALSSLLVKVAERRARVSGQFNLF